MPSAGLGDYWQQEYLLMTSVDLESPDEILDQKAVIDSGQNVSVTDGSIYLRNVNWSSGGETRTDIVRFSYENGEFQAVAGATLQGELTDEYALNEQDGYLRILLSGWDGSQQNNYVYVLDEDMNITGRIEGIAPERPYILPALWGISDILSPTGMWIRCLPWIFQTRRIRRSSGS